MDYHDEAKTLINYKIVISVIQYVNDIPSRTDNDKFHI